MLVRIFPHFFVVVVLFVAVPAVPSFVQLFSGSTPLLNYRNFVTSKKEKLTTNFYMDEERADTIKNNNNKKKKHSNYGSFQHIIKRVGATKIKKKKI